MSLNISRKSDPRICIIGNHANALLTFRGHLISDIIGMGFEVLALAPDYEESTRKAMEALNAIPVDYSLSRTGMNPLRDAIDTIRLAILLRQLKPDLILSYAIKPVIYGTIAARVAGIPQIFVTIEGLGYAFTQTDSADPQKRRLLRFAASFLYSIALRHATRAFFLNQDDIDEFLKRRIIAPEKVFLLGGIGVDLKYWWPAPALMKPVKFLMGARLLREKGIEEYAKAARIIRKKYPDTEFVLIGILDRNPASYSLEDIEYWAKFGTLKWLGCVPDVRSSLARSSVYVLPSYYREGVPRGTQEAMAMARPIITTDAPGCRDTVIDGVNGFLVPARDVCALAAAMERFILQPALIDEMGKASRSIAEERFDVHKVNKIILREMGLSEFSNI